MTARAERASTARVTIPWPRLGRRPAIWQGLGLGAVLTIAAVLNLARLAQEGYANSYYAAAVRSMLQSWHNFFFVSFDPGGFVTVDKPPLGFWLQTASAKLFGFHGWSILLPQALAGIASVAVLFYLVRRVFGPWAGLLAALALALTPVAVADNRNNTIDSQLVLVLLLGAWAVLRATESGKLRWLVLGMALVGVGFNIKMLEAYLVLPAFYFVYLVAAPRRLPVRFAHLALASVVLLVVSLSWAVAVDLTPASARPYVGSTQHNSELELAFGYNGIQRLLGQGGPSRPATSRTASAATASARTAVSASSAVPASGSAVAAPSSGAAAGGSAPGSPETGGPSGATFPPSQGGPPGGGNMFVNGGASPLRLADQQLGGQASWLIPLGLFGIIAAWGWLPAFISRRWRRAGGTTPQLGRREHSLLLWGGWLLTTGAFFSVASFFHPYYLIMLGTPAAALAGIGVVALWRAYRGSGWRSWLLPLALLATAAVQAYILQWYPSWSAWLTPLIISLSLLAAAVLVVARLLPRLRLRSMVLAAALALGLAGVFVVPAVWSGVTVTQGSGGGMPTGGPVRAGGFGGAPRPPTAAFRRATGSQSSAAFQPGDPPQGFGGPGGDTGSNTKLVSYLEANQAGYKFLVAVTSSQQADSIIIQTGEPVMATGGFSGSDPTLTTQTLAENVANGTVRYFLVGGGGGPGGGSSDLTTWMETHGTVVPASAYGGASTSSRGFGFGGGQQLYEVTSPASQG